MAGVAESLEFQMIPAEEPEIECGIQSRPHCYQNPETFCEPFDADVRLIRQSPGKCQF